MEKRLLNWRVPAPVAERFDQIAMERWGEKGKWVAATAAVLMYLDAPESLRTKYGNEALSTRGTVLPDSIKARLAPKPHGSKESE